ncbi:hypothetical protein JOC77_003148 [Peribacillus deserti]|uniref:MEDS domain-containing protein n=1 Tax=Peribacillus deserti TaxID=673318 RepID=A0ABS2QLR7_9BACI|nr:MEDS domain-containing protein [Peribacillus deserti]MBM7693704.1 hypothetical protein [Peribacillus deserti]
MSNLLETLINDLRPNGGHIFYHYNNKENYIHNVVSFIVTGIKNGDHILLAENDRHMLDINKKLQKELSKGQLENLHFINNYDFYYSNGNFHPHTIVNYFLKNIEPFIEKGASLCSWGLIEWGEDKEINDDVVEYEKQVDSLVKEKGITSVCAYDSKRTSDSLKELLMRCHGVMLTDDEVVYLKQT